MPGHYEDPKIYDLLASQLLSETTVTQLNNASKSTFVQDKNIEFWSGIITVARALEESRTYSHGLPIPEASSIESVSVADGAADIKLQPSGTEIWLIQALDLDSCTMMFTDGSTGFPYSSSVDYISRTRNPLYLTNTLYVEFTSPGSGDTKTPKIAVHKVSL